MLRNAVAFACPSVIEDSSRVDQAWQNTYGGLPAAADNAVADEDDKRTIAILAASDDLRSQLAASPSHSPSVPTHQPLPSALQTLAEHACRHDRRDEDEKQRHQQQLWSQDKDEEGQVAVRSCLEAAVDLAVLVAGLSAKAVRRSSSSSWCVRGEAGDLEALVDKAGLCVRHYARSGIGGTARDGVLGPHPLALGAIFVSLLTSIDVINSI
jgi:hypothetical protein